MPKQVQLNSSEVTALMEPQKGQGGYQSLFAKLQGKVDTGTGEITLDDHDLDRIPAYAYDYGNGGWETQLMRIFGRVLGDKLGR